MGLLTLDFFGSSIELDLLTKLFPANEISLLESFSLWEIGGDPDLLLSILKESKPENLSNVFADCEEFEVWSLFVEKLFQTPNEFLGAAFTIPKVGVVVFSLLKWDNNYM